MKVLITALVILALPLGGAAADTMYLSIETGLMVFDRQAAAESLGNWAEANGGYFTMKSDEYVHLRVPDARAEAFRGYVEGISDGILSFGRVTTDLGLEILRLTAAVEAREEILQRNLELLDSSDVEGTLELEREIRRLMNEIDSSRGRLRRLQNDARYASIAVSLSFRSQTLPDHRPSNFGWINGVDFYGFISGYPRNDGKWLAGDPIDKPAGFAEIESSRSYMAISPEGIRLRIVRVENYPEQGADFWIAALSRDLRERGYLEMEEDIVLPEFDSDEPFLSTLWGMPVGEEDYLYLIGLRVSGRQLELLEMAGQAEYVMKYLVE